MPIRVPPTLRGQLYTLPGGDYVAAVINDNVDDADTIAYGRTPTALFRVAAGHDVGRVGVMYPGDAELRDVRFKFDGTFLAVPLREFANCAVVKLFVTGRSGKAIGPDVFAARPRMCADPDSSFEDVSER